MTRRLAIETSGAVGSVALTGAGGAVHRRFLAERRRHAGGLPPAIAAVLAEAGVRPADVDEVVVGAGPGSFTGVRVAGAAANGFAHALGIPVVPVSSLAAAALTASVLPAGAGPWPTGPGEPAPPPDPAVPLRVLFDARGERLFTACYRVGPTAFEVIDPPRFTVLADLVAEAGPAHLCGDGAIRHAEILRARGFEIRALPAGVPTADGLLAAWARGAGGPPRRPGEWAPHYLRDTGAVRERRGDGA